MKTFTFCVNVAGFAKGTVIAKDRKEAKEMILGGQWEDLEIDVEDVYNIEYVKESKQNNVQKTKIERK